MNKLILYPKALTESQKEEIYKTERIHKLLMESQNDVGLYHAYCLIAGKTKEQAEKILNTPLAD